MQEPFKETNANRADISSYLTRCVVDLVLSESHCLQRCGRYWLKQETP